jgi:acetyl-CoA carboxylase biotin carboxyl carrier protein
MTKKQIITELPGIFYRKPNPEAEEFVKEGGEIQQGDILGLIEIMKTFQEVIAEEEGTNIKFLVNEGDFIEAGQAIAEVE